MADKTRAEINLEFGAVKMEALEIFEATPRYEEEVAVKLVKLANKIQGQCTDEERAAMIKEFAEITKGAKVKENAPEKIYLWPEGKVPTLSKEYTDNSEYKYHHNPDFRPYMIEMLVADDVTPKGMVVLVAGGDHAEAVTHEAYQSAKDFNALGYQAVIVLNRPNNCPWLGVEAGADCSRAIRYVRKNAEYYRIKPNQVAYAGFSNGGITGEQVIINFSGDKKMTDHFPDYVPDELDEYYGAPDCFLCVYGPRWVGAEMNWDGVVYPPVFYAIGREDKALDNFNWVYPEMMKHGVPVEVHTFAGVPHGKAGASLIDDNYGNFDMWVPLADYFMQDLYKKN